MPQRLSVSSAARLVDVPRGTLQRMMARGELASFDGMIDAEELLRAFPDARPEPGGALDRVARIREEAFGRRIAERALPPREILSQRLYALGRELADTRQHLSAYHALLTELRARLERAAAHDASAREWHAMLEEGLARILAAESRPDVATITEAMKVVSASVVVRPSGHEFLVEGHDSLLQAGLKAGLGFDYGCGGGTCGLCKARVVAGEVRPIRHSDYRMSSAEQRAGHVLLCTHTAITDVVIETLEASGPADIPEQALVARVRAMGELGADTRLLHLQTPRSARLRYLAGQSVTLGASFGDDDASATYPVASCPCDERNLLFHVARDSGDAFAERLFAGELAAGAEVNVRGPWGRFVLDAASARASVFLACDTGFAPVRGLIEHAISLDDGRPLALHWLATRPDGHYLERQCLAWAAALDGFRYEPQRGTDVRMEAERLCAAAASAHGAHADYYVSGPDAFVGAALPALRAAGAAADRIFHSVTG